jgi:F-type H+-transporting ATPase subunit delta
MKTKNIKKYASALFQVACETNQVEEIKNSFEKLKPLYEQDIIDFFLNPFIDDTTKKELLKEESQNLPETIVRFLYLLVEKRGFHLLSEIQNAYSNLIYKSKNVLIAKVVTPYTLEKPHLEKIKNILTQLTKKEILIQTEMDKSIISGIIIKTGDLFIDGSIKTKLNLLKQEILNEA